MLKRDPNFQRLKMGGRGWNGSASYWLGPDHLLVVEVVNYKERYRRFYFRDIQAVVVQQNRQQLWINLILGAFLVLALVVMASIIPTSGNWTSEASIGVGVATVIGLLLLAGMLRNTFRGSTCSVLVRTAVQTQKLKNLDRWRGAEKLLERLQPAIFAAQSPQTAPGPQPAPIASQPAETEGPPTSGETNP